MFSPYQKPTLLLMKDFWFWVSLALQIDKGIHCGQADMAGFVQNSGRSDASVCFFLFPLCTGADWNCGLSQASIASSEMGWWTGAWLCFAGQCREYIRYYF